jgi:hypothetical protein
VDASIRPDDTELDFELVAGRGAPLHGGPEHGVILRVDGAVDGLEGLVDSRGSRPNNRARLLSPSM